jgi:hypothetical protein
VIGKTDKARSRHLLERIRRVLLRGDPRDEHLGPGGDTAGGVSGAGIERLLKGFEACRETRRRTASMRDVRRSLLRDYDRSPKRDGTPPPGRCQPLRPKGARVYVGRGPTTAQGIDEIRHDMDEAYAAYPPVDAVCPSSRGALLPVLSSRFH